jgi:alpha-N-arabinofuranosidase
VFVCAGGPSGHFGRAFVGRPSASDGIKNLVKYALGIDPGIVGCQGRVDCGTAHVSGADYLSITYKCPEPAVATFTVRTSANLATGFAESFWVSSTSVAGIRTTTVRDGVSIQDATRRFILLEVAE